MSDRRLSLAPVTALVKDKTSDLKKFMSDVLNKRKKVFFDSPGLLEQSQHWGGMVIWTIAVGTSAGLLWAFLGKVDQTVVAVGTLQPSIGKVVVNSPSSGIVRELFVEDGEYVNKGSKLMIIESKGTAARLEAVKKRLAFYQYENQLYNLLIDNSGDYDFINLPPPPDEIRDEDRTRAVQLTVQEAASRLRQLKARLKSQSKTLFLRRELVDSLEEVYEVGGLAKFDYLNSVDELQRLESQILETSHAMTAVTAQAGRQVSNNERQLLSMNADRVALDEQSKNLTVIALQSGVIFNLSAGPGSVIGSGTEVMRSQSKSLSS